MNKYVMAYNIFIPVENIIMVLLRIPFRSYAAVMFAMESSIHDIIAVNINPALHLCFPEIHKADNRMIPLFSTC